MEKLKYKGYALIRIIYSPIHGIETLEVIILNKKNQQ